MQTHHTIYTITIFFQNGQTRKYSRQTWGSQQIVLTFRNGYEQFLKCYVMQISDRGIWHKTAPNVPTRAPANPNSAVTQSDISANTEHLDQTPTIIRKFNNPTMSLDNEKLNRKMFVYQPISRCQKCSCPLRILDLDPLLSLRQSFPNRSERISFFFPFKIFASSCRT